MTCNSSKSAVKTLRAFYSFGTSLLYWSNFFFPLCVPAGINCEGSRNGGKDTIEAEYRILDCLQMLRRGWGFFFRCPLLLWNTWELERADMSALHKKKKKKEKRKGQNWANSMLTKCLYAKHVQWRTSLGCEPYQETDGESVKYWFQPRPSRTEEGAEGKSLPLTSDQALCDNHDDFDSQPIGKTKGA